MASIGITGTGRQAPPPLQQVAAGDFSSAF
jgi:hypothetical protein